MSFASSRSSDGSSGSASLSFMHQFKVLMIGDSGVGKSSLFHRYANDQFTPNFLPTIGIDYKIKNVTMDDKHGVKRTIRLSLWDTAGQERFRTITKQYFRGAHGMALVYDSTDRASFENVDNWLSQVEQQDGGDGVVIILVANKCDHPYQAVSVEEGQALADERGIKFFKTSAKSNINVTEMFTTMTLEIERRLNLKKKFEERPDVNYGAGKYNTVQLTKLNRENLVEARSACCGGATTVPNMG